MILISTCRGRNLFNDQAYEIVPDVIEKSKALQSSTQAKEAIVKLNEVSIHPSIFQDMYSSIENHFKIVQNVVSL